jgi:hypothetical protein
MSSYEKGKQVDVAILDFSKAFDTVLQDKLLHKLNQYGVRDPIHSWLTTFQIILDQILYLEVLHNSQ